MPSGGRLIAAGLGLVGGTALQLQQAMLWPRPGYAMLAAVALLAGVLLRRRRGARWAGLGGAVALAALAFAVTGLRAAARLDEALPAALEGVDVEVVGVVASLPQRAASAAWRFQFEVEAARHEGRPVELPRRLALSWYAQGETPPPALRAGERWRLTLRLKRPHGAANPWGFDHELYLFERSLRATGYVRGTREARHERLAEGAGYAIDRARQAVRDAIEARVAGTGATLDSATSRDAGVLAAPDAPTNREAGVLAALDAPTNREAGVLAALAVGDQAAIERDDWALYRQTGVAHLMSISGLHVTMFAWLAGLAIGPLWRRSVWAIGCCPAPQAARWGGLLAALAYAVFAGWGVPAQRTVLMLATTTLVGAAGLRWGWPLVWGSAAVVVAAVDPWALLQPGFWLSFVAVGLLLASGEARPLVRAASGLDAATPPPRRPGALAALRRAIGGGLRTQAIATLGLAPLTLVFFQQLSLVGFAANLLAIPLVTLAVTPLALLGVFAPPLWTAAAALVAALNAVLEQLASPGWALWSVPAAPAWAVAAGLLGGALALLPLPWRLRALAATLLLPLLWPATPRPVAGSFELLAVDVGQGSAVLLRTAGHTLLYDTGPRYSAEAEAGERVLLPLLRALGETRLDALMLSHRDGDHVGGAEALLRALPVAALSGALEPAHPLWALGRAQGASLARCEAGRRWVWDGVAFELLHPSAELLDRAAAAPEALKPNALSCVLRVQGRWGGRERAVLLAGDIERAQEAALVERHGAALASELLFVPHHGSKTSSSAAFLDAVAPRVAIVQAGYRNRFGHPAPEVLARYQERGIAVIDSPRCGAWRFGADGGRCWRAVARRYWQHPERIDGPSPHNGAEVAETSRPLPAD